MALIRRTPRPTGRRFGRHAREASSHAVIRLLAPVLLVALVWSPLAVSPSAAQEAPDRSKEAERNLSYYLGRWESHVKILGRDGTVVRETSGAFGEEVLIDSRLNLHTSYNADGTENKAYRFYSASEDKFYLVDVTWKGDLWVVSGDGEYAGNRMTSLERVLPDGRKIMLRFNHTNIQKDSFDATTEISFDGGATWKTSSQATYRRSGEDPKGRAEFEKLASYLSNGSGSWRTSIDSADPADEGSPEALGLLFETTAGGHALELTMLSYVGSETRSGTRSTWFWHPVRRKIIYQEISPDGAIRMGTVDLVDDATFETLTETIDPNGNTNVNRTKNIMLSDRSIRTVDYTKGPDGDWVEQRTLTWEMESSE